MIKAKFSNKTKEEIFERDWWECVLCWINTWLQFHHVLFSNQANYWKDRNNVTQWITCCFWCHILCHWCKQWEWYRQWAIDYINNYYKWE